VQTQSFGITGCEIQGGKHLKQTFNTAIRELSGGARSEMARRARTPIAQRSGRLSGAAAQSPQQRAIKDAAAALAALWQAKR
jgi:hypothetical protein